MAQTRPRLSAAGPTPRFRPTIPQAALRFDVTTGAGLLWQALLLMVHGVAGIQGGSFVESSLRQERSTSTGLWGLGVVAPALAVSLLVTAGLVLVLLLCLIRKLRQAEGTYQPRREEETGSRGIETPTC